MTYAQVLNKANRLGSRGLVTEEVQILRDFLARDRLDPEEESLVLSSLSSAQLRAGDPTAATRSVQRALEIAENHRIEGAEAKARLHCCPVRAEA
jgi:hypothetical protein